MTQSIDGIFWQQEPEDPFPGPRRLIALRDGPDGLGLAKRKQGKESSRVSLLQLLEAERFRQLGDLGHRAPGDDGGQSFVGKLRKEELAPQLTRIVLLGSPIRPGRNELVDVGFP
jgi:hypothetical protein